MNANIKVAVAVSALMVSAQVAAQVTFYEGDRFHGSAFTTRRTIPDFSRTPLNDRTSSIVVDGGAWEVCADANFRGRCVVLRPGRYASLRDLGMDNTVSSTRPLNERRRYRNEVQAAADAPDNMWRRRADERVYDAPVTSVRAVMGPPTQHCWVERQQVSAPARGDINVGGALAGAVIGGVLGHQVGGGSGKDLATAGGAVAGGVIGSNMGRDPQVTSSRDVQRCENDVSGTPAYWDVTYKFRNTDHSLQMTAPPGATIPVNDRGEPRQ